MWNEMTDHEEALESFAESVWREAESSANNAGWTRAYERLWAVQMYLAWLRLYPIANIAHELKGIAAIHSGQTQELAAIPPNKGRTLLRHSSNLHL